MEQEFDVEIKEVLSRVQKVKAESLDDAINNAMDGQVTINWTDFLRSYNL